MLSSSSLSGGAPRLISLGSPATANTIFYTVPSGRRFIGIIFASSTNIAATVAGISWGTIPIFSTPPRVYEFEAGTTFSCGTAAQNAIVIYGKEVDA